MESFELHSYDRREGIEKEEHDEIIANSSFSLSSLQEFSRLIHKPTVMESFEEGVYL